MRRPRSASQVSIGPGDRAVQQPVPAEPLAQLAAGVVGRVTTAPRMTSECPARYFVTECSDDVGPGLEGALDAGEWRRCCRTTVSTPRSRAAAQQRRQVGDLEHRVGGRLDPQQRGAVEDVAHRPLVVGIQATHAHRARLLELVEQRGRAVVGVRRAPRRCRRARPGSTAAATAAMPEAKTRRLAALQRPERLLERRPGGVAGAGVVDRPVGDVGRGELQGSVHAGAGQPVLAGRGRRRGWRGRGARRSPGQPRRGDARRRRGARRVGDTLTGDDYEQPAARRKTRVALVFGGRSSRARRLVLDRRRRACAPSTATPTTSSRSGSRATATGCSPTATPASSS